MIMSYLLCLRCKTRLPIILFICLAGYSFFTKELKTTFPESHKDYENFTVKAIAKHEEIVKEFYGKRMNWITSKLGAILFKNEQIPKQKDNRKYSYSIRKFYLILVYQTWDFLRNRNVHFESDEAEPLNNCSVKNCRFTISDDMINLADAVVIHIRRSSLPQIDMINRNPDQRMIFIDDESPPKLMLDQKGHLTMAQMYNVFNWSMSYRSDADIPVPFGRTVALKSPKLLTNSSITTLVPFWKRKRRDVLISTVLTDCNIKYKFEILNRLKEHIPIHFHDKCNGDSMKFGKCEGIKGECKNLSKYYLFYLVFENTKCKEYMTEKLFFLAYSKGAIPIIQGPSIEDCKKLLPPNSYIHIDQYSSIKDLVTEIKKITDNENKLLSYHAWRNHFEVVNEHGYYGTESQHLCRICEAMNYNDNKQSVYRAYKILSFLNPYFVRNKERLCKK